MTPAPRFHLKQASGWFAAGREIACAATLLSDAAFKLFVWLCLHADRSRGSISAVVSELAGALGRSVADIRQALEELIQKGVCRLGSHGAVEITDRFWPYERIRSPCSERPEYVERIRRVFLGRNCVRSTFTAADENLATELYRIGIPIADVEHAILLGALRKYAALLNNGRGTPITSLYYFKCLFDEVREPVSPDYWIYIEQKVRRIEQRLVSPFGRTTTETK